MTAPLTPEREQEIRARANAATPGPWGIYDDETGLFDIAADLEDTGHGYRCRRYVGQLEAGQIDNDPTHKEWTEEQDRAQVEADAEFVAHAREDVPALLAEVDRLRAELAEARARALNEVADDYQQSWSGTTVRYTADWLRDRAREQGAAPAPTAPRTEQSYWVAIADALNAALDAGMPIGIDLDGTLTDHNTWSVVWDRAAEQWAVAGYEDDDTEAGDNRG